MSRSPNCPLPDPPCPTVRLLVHVAQEPADAERVAERAAPQGDRRFRHLAQHLGGHDAGAVLRVAVTEVEPGPANLVVTVGEPGSDGWRQDYGVGERANDDQDRSQEEGSGQRGNN